MTKNYMGVDPSTTSTGFAILNEKKELLKYGTINPPEGLSHQDKLKYLFNELNELIRDFEIQGIVCEDQFSRNNVDTLKKLTRTCSIVMLVSSLHDLPLELSYPSSWRKVFHGKGNVVKKDTVALVNVVHNLKLRLKDNDIADAIGLAHVGVEKWIGGC